MKKFLAIISSLIIGLTCALPAFAYKKQDEELPVFDVADASKPVASDGVEVEIGEDSLNSLSFVGRRVDSFVRYIDVYCSSLHIPPELIDDVNAGNIWLLVTDRAHDKIYGGIKNLSDRSEVLLSIWEKAASVLTGFGNNTNYEFIYSGNEYSLVLTLYNRQTKDCVDLAAFTLKLSEKIFNTLYDEYRVSSTPLFIGESFHTTYIQIYGQKTDAGSAYLNEFSVQTNLNNAYVYSGNVLPEFSSLKGIPTGLKATSYYVLADDNKTYFEPGDYAYNKVTYLIEVAIDTSDLTTIIPGLFNYIVWKLFEPIYSGSFVDF